jgi:GntR family trehalose operon transcriptional repressor
MAAKYQMVYEEVRQGIFDGRFADGSYLPSEDELAEQYGLSRGTVRRALSQLQEEGLIQKIHGHGAMVLDPRQFDFPTDTLTSFSELSKQQKLRYTTKVVMNKAAFLTAEQLTEFNVNGKYKKRPGIQLERVRVIDGKPLVFDQDFFFSSIVGASIPAAAAQASVYRYLERDKKLKIGFARKKVTVEPIDAALRLILDLRKDTHIVVVRSLVYLENATLFQIHKSFQRVDTFNLTNVVRRDRQE